MAIVGLGVIAHALQVLGHHQGLDQIGRRIRLGLDAVDDILLHAVEHLVDAVVRADHGVRALLVAMHVGAHGLMHHRAGAARHGGQVRVELGVELAVERQHDVGDVGRLVADALEIAHHLERGAHAAQVAGDHRLLHQQQLQAQALDVALEVVDLVVVGEDLARLGHIARGEHLHRRHQRRFGRRGHALELLVEQVKLRIEPCTSHGDHPNLPVM